MEHWVEGRSMNGYGENGLILKEGDGRILSVVKNEDGIRFMEECDNHFGHTYTKQQVLELIDELRNWIEGH